MDLSNGFITVKAMKKKIKKYSWIEDIYLNYNT